MSITWAVLGLVVVFIFLLGIRIVRPTHRALVERLGRYQRFGRPGFNWVIPVIDKLYPVNVTEQMVDAEVVVLWGIDAASTHINLMTLVKEARRRGAHVVCIDPYRTRTARQADEHLMVRSGTDAYFVNLTSRGITGGSDTGYALVFADHAPSPDRIVFATYEGHGSGGTTV